MPRATPSPHALAVARLMRTAVHEAGLRPVFDSEHGPIHSFKDKKRTLPARFDDEYHRHIQWAHLASGGAGGGMRWPNRHPHVLTPGMREAQRALAAFLPLVDWTRFRRRNLSAEMACDDPGVAVVGCGDERQALAWLVRTDSLAPDGTMLPNDAAPPAMLDIPGLADGVYTVLTCNTHTGAVIAQKKAKSAGGMLRVGVGAVRGDLAVVVRPAP